MKSSSLRSMVALTLFALALGAVSAVPAMAQEAASGGYKIGIVDMQTVLADYQKRKSGYATLEAEVKRRQTEIDALSTTIEGLKTQYEAATAEEQRATLRKQIEDKYAEYRTKLEANQREIDRQEEEVLKEVLADVEAALKTLAEREGYHLIMNGRSSPRGTVLYYSTTIDITSSVLAALNSGGGAAAAAPAPASDGDGGGKRGKR